MSEEKVLNPSLARGYEKLWEEIEKDNITNEKARAEIKETLTKWNITESELLLVLWVTLKQKEEGR